ncbi:MAG: helix-turn-helix domain-containing protein [Anaerolineae bacterium]|nr:helix-turn-helix domain-containing protein [Anaerolineae bacterium]
MDTLLTAKQVQELLNVDRTTIYRMLKDGRLAGVKVGQHWRFRAHEVEELMQGGSASRMESDRVDVSVLPLHCMQPVQDVFGEIAEVGSVTTNTNGEPLTRISNCSDFCKLIMGSAEGRAACMSAWRSLVERRQAVTEFVTCHAGLQYASAPIEVQGELVAILVAGQFFTSQPDPEEEAQRIQTLAKKFDVDPQLLAQAAGHLSVLDERKVSQIGQWLQRVALTFNQISSERAGLMHRLRQIAEMSDIELTNL